MVHIMEDGAVQCNTESTVGAHDHSTRHVSIGVGLGVDLEGTGTTFFPLFVEVVELAFGSELGGLILFSGFNFFQ